MAIKGDGIFNYHVMQDRERRNLSILELIRSKGPISKAEISRAIAINIVTIANYTDYYINKRLILEVGLDVSTGGRRPELLELNARWGYIVGVDIGPETISAVVTDLKVNVIGRSSISRPSNSMEGLIDKVIDVAAAAIKESGISAPNLKNIGIGISGIVDYLSGTIRDTDPARGKTRVSFLKFAKDIERKFNIPVYIGNDASCAVFGEKMLNPVADADNLLYLYSDVGCGIVVHGDVYIGSSGCAGETQVSFKSHQTDEKTYVKEYTYMRPWGVDLGIVYNVKKAIQKGLSTEVIALVKGNADNITKEMVLAAARKNDAVALEAVETAARNLGVKIAYMINLFNPAIVIIGGGMEAAGDILMEPLKDTVKKLAFEEPASAVKIMPSFLGKDAVVLGAAALAAREVFIGA